MLSRFKSGMPCNLNKPNALIPRHAGMTWVKEGHPKIMVVHFHDAMRRVCERDATSQA